MSWTVSGGSSASQKERGRPGLGSAVVTLAAAAAVLGPIAFAVLHSVYAQFYEAFGLVPEDVGIDSTKVLTTSLIAFGAAFFVWMLLWFVVLAVPAISAAWIAPTDDPATPRRGKALSHSILVGACAMAVGILVAFAISRTGGVSTVDKILAWLAPLSVPIAVTVGAWRAGWATTLRGFLERKNLAFNAFVIVLAFSAAFSAGTIISDVSDFGKQQAAEVKSGHALLKPELPVPSGSTRLRAVDIQAAVAHVYWLGSRPPTGGPQDCLMYLGASDGVAFLWNVDARALLRVPESTIVVTTIPDAKRCP